MKESNEATLRLQELRRLQRQDRKRRLEGSLRQAFLVAAGEAYPQLVFPCPSCGGALAVTAQYTGFEAYCGRCGNSLEIPDCESNDFGLEKFGREIQRQDSVASQDVYKLDQSYLANVTRGEPHNEGSSKSLEILGPEAGNSSHRSEHNVVLSIVVNREGEISTVPQNGNVEATRGQNGDFGEEWKGQKRKGGQRAIKTPVKSTLELAITSDGGRETTPSLTVWQSQSEQREWERLVAFGLLGLLLVVVTAFCIYLFMNNANRNATAAAAANTKTDTANNGQQGIRELPISAVAPADLEEAKWVIRHYVTAATWRERLPYVRMPERVTPLMEAYYATNPDGIINQSSMEMTWAGFVRGHFLIVITVVDTNYKEHYFTLERMGDEYKIDWEVLVEYNPMSWKEFKEKRPTEPVTFRVSLTADQYYNFQFADATKYQSFRLASRDEFVGLYGYAPRAAEWFRHIDLAPGFTRLVMIEMRFPDSAQGSNQVEITNFVRPSWVVFPEDLDNSLPAPDNTNSAGAPGTPVVGMGPEDKSRVRYTERPSGPVMSSGTDAAPSPAPAAPLPPKPVENKESVAGKSN